MNIDDILRQKDFKGLDDFLTMEMKAYADDRTIRKMVVLFGSEDSARDWFYSKIVSLGNKRPYDLCREGSLSKVTDVLGRIEHGIYI